MADITSSFLTTRPPQAAAEIIRAQQTPVVTLTNWAEQADEWQVSMRVREELVAMLRYIPAAEFLEDIDELIPDEKNPQAAEEFRARIAAVAGVIQVTVFATRTATHANEYLPIMRTMLQNLGATYAIASFAETTSVQQMRPQEFSAIITGAITGTHRMAAAQQGLLGCIGSPISIITRLFRRRM